MDITHFIKEKAGDFDLKETNLPKYVLIRDFLKLIIGQQTALYGSKMPSTRALAAILNVSRNSVNKAYDLLVFERVILSKAGSGHLITADPVAFEVTKSPLDLDYPAISESGKQFMQNVAIIDQGREISTAFRPGLPPLDIFPVNQWKKLYNLYWRNVKTASLNYTNVSGQQELKQHIAEYLYYTKGVSCHPEQVVVVSGSVQSLYLLATSLIDPGEEVVLENPTFPNVQAIFKSVRAGIHAVDIDGSGIRINDIPKSARPKLIHVTPSNHYPSCTRMSLERKMEVLQYAYQNACILIENDYEHEVNDWYLKSPALFTLDKQERTVYLGTFNRLLHPSVRLAYMVLPTHLLAVVKAIQKHTHRFVSSATQAVMAEFIRRNYLLNHIKNVVEINQERRQIFFDFLKDNCNFSLFDQSNNSNSLHSLYTYPADIPDKIVVEKLHKQEIVGHSFSNCFVKNPQNGLIFGHAAIHRHLMPSKLNALCKVFNSLKPPIL